MNSFAAPCELVLHLGAHRTGTTTLQAGLDNTLRTYSQSNVLALTPPRAGKRGSLSIRKVVNLAGRLRRPLHRMLKYYAKSQARQIFETLLPDSNFSGRLILSDEKMLGGIFSRKGVSIYPNAESHLTSLSTLLPCRVTEIHLTIRSYDTFIVSAHAMRYVYGRNIPPFKEIEEKLVSLDRSWCDLVHTLRTVFPTARIVLSEFEKDSMEKRLASLLGSEFVDVELTSYIPSLLNPSPTLEAIQYVATHGKPGDPDALLEQFSGGTKYSPLDSVTSDRLHELYETDISTLRTCDELNWL